ncbi:MAG: YkgJ family cysteine cluster protein [Myxococcaceae bacterium]
MTESPCAQCPKVLGASCCEVGEGEQLATLTSADIERISAYARLAPRRFAEVEWLTEEEAHAYEARRPLYAGYFRHRPARWTLQRRAGACVFLKRDAGCTLPAELRPTACRLYPFELWPDGSWSLQVDRFGDDEQARAAAGSACLAVERAEQMDDVLRAFALTRDDVDGLGAQIRDDVKAHTG